MYDSISSQALILILLAFLLSFGSVFLVRKYLQNLLIDVPNERSSHVRPTPRGGGLGFIVAFTIIYGIAWVLGDSITQNFSPLALLTLMPLAIVGMIDDLDNVPAKIRYLVQLCVASAIVYQYGSLPILTLDNLGIWGLWIGVFCTIISLTALINFYNFMDGLDGLVAGVSVVQMAFLAIFYEQPILWLWIAALCGFLYWNWSPAKIFMGDVGSTTLGAVIGISCLSVSQQTEILSWKTLFILLPLISDAVYTLLRRIVEKENIFQAHRSHIYQRLHQSGLSHAQIATIYMGSTILVAIFLCLGGEISILAILLIVAVLIIYAENYLAKNLQEN